MSLHILASGVLTAAPQTRTSASGKTFCTGTLKSPGKEGDAFVSLICFNEDAQAELLALSAGDGLAICGPGKLTAWTGKDGQEKHGLSVVVDRLLPNTPRPRPKAPKAPGRRTAPALAEAEFNDAMPF